MALAQRSTGPATRRGSGQCAAHAQAPRHAGRPVMTPAFAARLTPARQRLLALGILVLMVALALVVLVVPVLLAHRHYDAAIDDLSDKLMRYRRVAAQAPELRAALEAVKAKDAHR